MRQDGGQGFFPIVPMDANAAAASLPSKRVILAIHVFAVHPPVSRTNTVAMRQGRCA